jgi:NAD(P)-dependent dehydrogenase (short-subunit alcohol dehydrogenase family)
MGPLDGKVAIVTGAARGIGKGMATALVKAGAAVTITDITKETLEATGGELRKLPGARVLAILADGTDDQAVKDAVRRTADEFGRIDILINNAQAALTGVPLEQHKIDDLAFAFNTGFYASFRYMVACLPYLKETRGTVINFASDAGILGNWGMVGYNATKEAIRALTRTAAREWAQHGITVNCIVPGMLTEGSKAFFERNPEHFKKSMESIALGRLGDPELDAGSFVVFLGSSGRYFTGETFNLNGGRYMRP